jgi:hypothetical protein
MKTKTILVLLAVAGCATLAVAFEIGKGKAFTKRYETKLLKKPDPLAESAAFLHFSTKVDIIQFQGKWAQVSAATSNGPSEGWIYLGNLAEKKPAQDQSIAALQTDASGTTSSVAARPLDGVTRGYVEQEAGLAQAADDLKWLEEQSAAISNPVITDYLKANKKGEYQ